MRRIAFFVINNVVAGGGMVATENAIRSLSEQGNEVFLIVEDLVTDEEKHLFDDTHVKVIEVGTLKKEESVSNLIEEIKRYNIDIFITHAHYYLPVIKTFPKIRNNTNAAIILNEHHYNFIPLYEKRLELYKERESYLKSADLISVIEPTSFQIWKSSGYNTVLLPNTYYTRDIDENLVSNKKNQVVISARFVDFKQVDLGIAAFAQATLDKPDWELVILGKGPHEKRIINLINTMKLNHKVKLVGWTSEAFKYFQESKIHLLPSYTEPFGLVIMDAKNAKIPSVMFDLPSNNLVEDGVTGYRVPLNDIDELSNKLALLMNNDELRATLGEQAYSSIESFSNSSDYTSKVWQEMISFVTGSSVVDEQVYEKHFINGFDPKKDLDALVFDYNTSINWFVKKLPKPKRMPVFYQLFKILTKGKNKKKRFTDLYNRVKSKYLNKIGVSAFRVLSKYLPQDHVVYWDSNGVAFTQQAIVDKFPNIDGLQSKVIIPKAKYLSIYQAYYFARSKFFITNTNTRYQKLLQSHSKKSPTCINIWHGCGQFKRFGKDENHLGILNFQKRFGVSDYVTCSSESLVKSYSEIFGVEQSKVLPIGSPRTDLFFDRQYIEGKESDFFQSYPELKGKKIYVFAPTWRGTPFKGNTAHFTPKLDFSKVAEYLSDDEVILIKNHQLVIKNKQVKPDCYSIEEVKGKIINADHEDIVKLTVVSDVFITDFSSAFFEAMLIDKPVMFYAEDVDSYLSQNGIYGEYHDYIMGEVLNTPDPKMFVNAIRNSPSTIHSEKYSQVKNRFLSSCDGNSASKLLEFIRNSNH